MPGSPATLNRTLYKCRRCKLLFWTAGDASAHEAGCANAPHFNCTVCLVLRFRTDGERLEHERVCPGARPLRMADLPMADRALREEDDDDVVDLAGSDDSSSSVEVIEGRRAEPAGQGRLRERAREEAARAFRGGPPAAAALRAAAALLPADGTCTPAPAAAGSRTQPPTGTPELPAASAAGKPATPASASSAAGFVTMWTCDVCRVAQFESFDAAVEHERTCDGSPPVEIHRSPADGPRDADGAAGTAPAGPAAEDSVESRPREIFYQILRDSNDTPCFSRISPFHRTVLKSTSLWSVPGEGDAGGDRIDGDDDGKGDPVRFSCRFCGEVYSSTRIAADGSRYWSLADLTTDTYSR